MYCIVREGDLFCMCGRANATPVARATDVGKKAFHFQLAAMAAHLLPRRGNLQRQPAATTSFRQKGLLRGTARGEGGYGSSGVNPCRLAMPKRGEVSALALQADELLLSVRTSPDEVKREMQKCYDLVHKLGRGVVYLGSSRFTESSPHYQQTKQLAKEIAQLLDCTTWTGAGPGLMDAAINGALEAKKQVGGFKISNESGEWTSSNFHPYLPPETYLTCRFFSARKHGLVDAAVRNNLFDMTAVVALPGGIGTLDELLDFLDECEERGTVGRGEVESLCKVCDGNSQALDYLAEFYRLPRES